MKPGKWAAGLGALMIVLGGPGEAREGPFQLVSGVAPGQSAPAGGNGDSGAPVISQDRRYVLFASAANNLLLLSNNLPMPALSPAPLNVFLRDRVAGTTILVSVNLAGTGGGDGDSVPLEISTNGQSVLFESSASNLVAGDTNQAADLFMRDLVNGTTFLVSVSTNGGFGNGHSRSGVMTPDGRYIAFVSEASNLVPWDTNGIADVFVRDLRAGQTILASAGAISTGTTMQAGGSMAPAITPDGRYALFYSTATNLVPAVRTVADLYVRDLVNQTTTWASSSARTTVGSNNIVCFNHAITDDGRFVAYELGGNGAGHGTILRYDAVSARTAIVHTNAAVGSGLVEDTRSLDLTPDGRFIAFAANTNGTSGTTSCILLWDALAGTCQLISGNRTNGVATGSICDWPIVTPDARFVAFVSDAPNLTTNALAGQYHVYVRDVPGGVTMLADVDTNGVGAGVSLLSSPALSEDGHLVVFTSADGSIVPNDHNGAADLFLRDLTAGPSELISARRPDLVPNTGNGLSSALSASLSADGRYIAFVSDADNLTAGDTNRTRDVFVHDLATGTNWLVSVNTNGLSGDLPSAEPSLSADGRWLAFASYADDLVPGDTNNAGDVFIRDLQTGTITVVSVGNGAVGLGNKDSYAPILSANGRYLLFRSKATNLTAGSLTGAEGLFFRDLLAGTNYGLSRSLAAAAMTPDGRFVAVVSTAVASSGTYFIWDSLVANRVDVQSTGMNLLSLALSPDGNRVVCWTGSNAVQLLARDRIAQTNWTITLGASNSLSAALRFSRDGQVLAYNKVADPSQVWLYDFRTGANVLVSHRYEDASALASGASDSPDLSADGRFVAYRSAATDLVPGCTNGLPGIFLYDRQTGSNTLLSVSGSGNFTANNRSLTPVFSGDGQMLLFQSWASDLIPQDLNENSDLFAFTLLYVSLLPAGSPGRGPWLSWPVMPGLNYRVQFKDSLADPLWQELPDSSTNAGVKAYLEDPAPALDQRFYRVLAF